MCKFDYQVEMITLGEDDVCYDVYVTDDDGWTWEYYTWTDTLDEAHVEGKAAVKRAEAYTL